MKQLEIYGSKKELQKYQRTPSEVGDVTGAGEAL